MVWKETSDLSGQRKKIEIYVNETLSLRVTSRISKSLLKIQHLASLQECQPQGDSRHPPNKSGSFPGGHGFVVAQMLPASHPRSGMTFMMDKARNLAFWHVMVN